MKEIKQSIRRPRVGPIGTAILASVAVAGTISILALFPGMVYVVAPFIKKRKRKLSQEKIVEASVESLVRSGLVQKSIAKDGSVQLELTKKGKWESLLRSKSFDTKKEIWDSLWRVVVFDVPQEKNKMRRELRRAMKLYGFKMLQQSVWVYPHACDDFVVLLKNHLGVSNDVLYMKVAFIENDRHLRQEFRLAK